MMIRMPRGWEIPEWKVTPEHVLMNRRRFLKAMGVAGAGVIVGAGCEESEEDFTVTVPETLPGVYPVGRNPEYTVARILTREKVAARYNNFYEFTTDKGGVHRLVEGFEVRPWTVEVVGLVEKPQVFDVDDLLRRMPLEERVYRFRCVEAWAMTVPWTGFAFRSLIEAVRPLSSAQYVRMISFMDPEQAPGQKAQTWYPWPYYEGLTLSEAMNELTLLVTGIYGHALPKQHGAPIRLIVPWKYGYKSIKSVVRIEFVRNRPRTFWNDIAPREYDFWSNVNPKVPHPRWSQASERLIGEGERVPTRPYNGYGEYVAGLYKA